MARLYIDSNVFFYSKVNESVFGESCAEVLRRISRGSVEASISVLTPLEVSNALMKYGLAREVQAEIGAILSMNMEVYLLEPSDLAEVGEVSRKTGTRPYDCAHAVLMRRYGVSEIVSADGDFDRFDWLRRVDPRRFAKIG